MRNLYMLLILFIFTQYQSLTFADDLPSSPKSEFKHRCPKSSPGKLLIHHLAVGQGDSTFVKTPSGTTVLIDAGLPSMGEKEIVPTLKKCYRLKAIDYVVLTHFDADHMGGMDEVLLALPVKKAIYDPGDKANTKSTDPKSQFSKYLDVANRAKDSRGKKLRRIPSLGEIAIRSGDLVRFNVITRNGEILGGDSVDIWDEDGKPVDSNAVSIGVRIDFDTFNYFVAGDLTGGGGRTPDVESQAAPAVGDIDVLHANHHGSLTSNNRTFIETLKPEQIIISVGNGGLNGGTYHLPAKEVLLLMDELSFIKNIFQTAKGESLAHSSDQKKVTNYDGDIILASDGGKTFTVNDTQTLQTDGKRPSTGQSR